MPHFAPPEKLVAVVGGSGAGKSTLERALQLRLRDRLAVVPFDDFFVGMKALEGRTITNWEDPDLYRWEDFERAVRVLKAGRAATFAAHSRESSEAGIDVRTVTPAPITAVMGFLALHSPAVRELYTDTIYLHLEDEEIIRRRFARAKPGSPWDSPDYIQRMLLPGHRELVVPQRQFARHIVDASQPPDVVAEEVMAILLDNTPEAVS